MALAMIVVTGVFSTNGTGDAQVSFGRGVTWFTVSWNAAPG